MVAFPDELPQMRQVLPCRKVIAPDSALVALPGRIFVGGTDSVYVGRSPVRWRTASQDAAMTCRFDRAVGRAALEPLWGHRMGW